MRRLLCVAVSAGGHAHARLARRAVGLLHAPAAAPVPALPGGGRGRGVVDCRRRLRRRGVHRCRASDPRPRRRGDGAGRGAAAAAQAQPQRAVRLQTHTHEEAGRHRCRVTADVWRESREAPRERERERGSGACMPLDPCPRVVSCERIDFASVERTSRGPMIGRLVFFYTPAAAVTTGPQDNKAPRHTGGEARDSR